MKRWTFHILLCVGLLLPNLDDLDDDEHAIFFATAGHFVAESDEWVIPIHAWVFEPEEDSDTRRLAIKAFHKALGFKGRITDTFRSRTRAFVVDNERGQDLVIKIAGRSIELTETESNGHTLTEIRLSSAEVGELQLDEWLRFDLELDEDDTRKIHGVVQLVSPKGISVISDIDDTIKISEVHDRARLVANTFAEDYVTVPGMAEVYRRVEQKGAAFHYVSSSPWQLYLQLTEMIAHAKFPTGSMHLKTFRLKDSSFFDLLASPEKTKPPILQSIVERYPKRRFILFGDAGEKDPEVYGDLARKYPDQVAAIAIRVPRPEDNDPARFERAFRGIDRAKWVTFQQAAELDSFETLNQLVEDQ